MLLSSPSRLVPPATKPSPSKARNLLKVLAWGSGAILAAAGAVAAGRTDLGAKRAHAALAAMMSPPAAQDQQLLEQMGAWSSGLDKQMRRQAEVIRSLTEQRDALTDQVNAMEKQVSELGSSVSRMAAHAEADPQDMRAAQSLPVRSLPRIAPAARVPDPDIARDDVAPVGALPRGIGSIAPLPQAGMRLNPAQQSGRIMAFGAELPDPNGDAGVLPPPVAALTRAPDAVTPIARMQTWPPLGPPSLSGDPAGISGPVPLPRPNAMRLAQLNAASPQGEGDSPGNALVTAGAYDSVAPAAPAPVGMAVDLGSSSTVEGLRKRWNELRTTQSPLLDNLKPLVALKPGGKGGVELHLVAGPLPNHGAVTKLCGVLAGGTAQCQATGFEGQRLTQR